jgi:hypothetical protein
MNLVNNIFGCYVATTFNQNMNEQENKNIAELFRSYIYGKKGIYEIISKLEREKYGKDMDLILFQFSVNPIPYELPYLKEIENYRKKEKAISGWIIINKENFFNKSEIERYNFIKTSIVQKMDLLAEVVKKKKLDTNMKLLKADLQKTLDEWNYL